jgi:hypothetical protein
MQFLLLSSHLITLDNLLLNLTLKAFELLAQDTVVALSNPRITSATNVAIRLATHLQSTTRLPLFLKLLLIT